MKPPALLIAIFKTAAASSWRLLLTAMSIVGFAWLFAGTSAHAGEATWKSGVNGNWSVPGNWNSVPAGFVPNNGVNDENWTAAINSNNTGIVDVPITLQGFTMTSGAVDAINGIPLIVEGPMLWTAGSLGAAVGSGSGARVGVFRANGGLTISGAAAKTIASSGGRRGHLINAATATLSGGNLHLQINNDGAFVSAQLVNSPTGVFNFTDEADITLSGSVGGHATFFNEGTINKSGAGTTSRILSRLTNTGTINVISGTLDLAYNNGQSQSGQINIANGATLRFSGGGAGANTLAADSTLTGNGLGSKVEITFTGAAFNGDYMVEGTTLVDLSSNNYGFDMNSSNATTGELLLTGEGSMAGTGKLTVTRTATWTNSNLGGSVTLEILAGVTLEIGNRTGSSDKRMLASGKLYNYGIVNMIGNASLGKISVSSSSGDAVRIQNYGEWNVTDAAGITGGAGFGNSVAFVNGGPGVFTKSGAGTEVEVATRFYNYGTVNVQSGTLRLGGGGTGSVSSSTGSFVVAEGAVLSFTGGQHNLEDGAAITGAGTTSIAGGVVGGTGVVSISGPITWTGGGFTGAGTIHADGGVVISGTGNRDIAYGRALSLKGNSIWSGGSLRFGNTSGNYFNNYGIFDNTFDGSFTIAASGSGTFINLGVFTKSGGTGTTAFSTGEPFSNRGTVNANSGTLAFNGGYGQNATGRLHLGGGAVSTSGTLSINGGKVTGAGTITGNVSMTAATVAPNGSLAVTGNLTLTAASTVAVDLGGTTPGTGYDTISEAGAAALARNGTLAVRFANGFHNTVTAADTFTILTSNQNTTGQFANVSGGRVQTADGYGSFAINSAGTGAVVLSNFIPLPAGEIAVSGNGVEIASGDATPGAADHTDFGSVTGAAARIFTIHNTEAEPLLLTGAPLVEISGAHAADFAVTALPASPVAGGGSSAFTITFTPAAVGLRTATVSIASNDADENPYTFTIQGTGAVPEIAVSGNGQTIASGDTTPSAADHTDFGNVRRTGGTLERTFTIANSGDAILNLTGTPKVEISGTHAAEFTVTAQPESPVAAGGGTTAFTIRFDPAELGLRTAIVSIANDDADENPYTFAIQGTGTTPEIAVSGFGIEIANGDATPSVTDDTDFESVLLIGSLQARTFTIANTGSTVLNLTGSPKVQISGAHAAEFTVTAQPVSPVAASGETTFTISFDPAALGLRSALVSIANDDENENPYTFTIQGTGIAPEIAVSGNGAGIANGDNTPSTAEHTDFDGVLLADGTLERTFTIANTGSTVLNLTGSPKVQISGAHAADFFVELQPDSPVTAGGTTTFTIRFDPSALGVRNATVSIANDDADETPYIFAIRGTGIAPEIVVSGNGQTIANEDATPSGADHTDFGGVLLTDGTLARTFTLSNSGTAALNLTGSPKVEVGGEHAAEFTVTAQPVSPVAASGATTFTISFDPAALGPRSATLFIDNDDADENPYVFDIQGTGVEPDIVVELPEDPVIANVGSPQTVTLTLRNTGGYELTGIEVSVTDANGIDDDANGEIDESNESRFQITSEPAATVAPGGSTTFTMLFDPVLGQSLSKLSITSNDPDENPYEFHLAGTGVGARMIIRGGDEDIANGDAEPDAADQTDFGAVALLNTQVTRVFAIANSGNVPLNLTGTPRVQIGGAHAADFTVTAQPDSPLAAGEGETTFAITFDPHLPGLRTALVSIASDDPGAAPYTFAIAGFGGLDKPLAQTITFTPPATYYLGQGPLELVAEASSGLPVTLAVLSGPAELAGNVLTPTGPGKVKVQATQAGGGLYAVAKPVMRTINVKDNPTELTLIDLSQRYTGTPRPIATLGTADPVTITYQIGGAYGLPPPTEAGAYNVRATAGSVAKNGKLVITKAPLYVTPEDKHKFAGEANPPLTLSYDGFVNEEDAGVLASPPLLSTTAKPTSPGGLYPITSKGGVAANYAFIHRRGTLVVESFTGGYEALLVDGDALPVGKLSLTVAKSGRSFSAKLFAATETKPLPLRGALATNSVNEQAAGVATVVKDGVSYTVTFTLPMYGDVIANVTRNDAPLGAASAGRRLLAPSKGWKAAYAGVHTAVLEPAAPSGAGVPAGAGWAQATINTKGALKLAGKLGDGIAFTASLPPDVEANPGYRLFTQPYKPARIEAFLGGVFTLTPHPSLAGHRYLEEAVLIWDKAGLSKDFSYPSGFGPAATVLIIDPWLKPAGTDTLATLLGLPLSAFVASHSATGSASDPDLPTGLALSATNQVSVLFPATDPPNKTQWQIKLNVTNGMFTGSFELLDAGQKRKIPFSGILRQPSAASSGLFDGSVIGDGHFLLPAQPGAPSNERLSGEVLFQRP